MKKRYIMMALVLAIAGIFSGCGNKNFAGRDLEEVKQYLSSLPDSVDKLQKQGAFVDRFGGKKSRENWESFYQNVQAGTPDAIEFARYTTEGDAVITYVDYDGTDFYAVVDTTRDKWGQGQIFERNYAYLNTYEWESNGNRWIGICLADVPFSTQEESENSPHRDLGYLKLE